MIQTKYMELFLKFYYWLNFWEVRVIQLFMKNIVMGNDKYFNLIDFTYSIKYLEKGNNKYNMITYNRVKPPEMYYNNSEYDYNSDYYRLGSVIWIWLYFQTLLKSWRVFFFLL